jgi:phage recombination protein Bet
MTKEIIKKAKTNEEKPMDNAVIRFEVDGQEVKLSKKLCQEYIVSGGGEISDSEFNFFMTLCRKMKLNPYAKDCYIIKYNSKNGYDTPATIVTSKDVIFRRAMSHPDFDGLENGVIVETENGEITERKGGFVAKSETLVGAWAKAYRKSVQYPYYISLSLDEVIQKKADGTVNKMWSTKPAMMSIKVASVRVLREMFTEELQGLYDADEIKQEPTKSSGFTVEDVKSEEPQFVDVDVETGEVIEDKNKIDLADL